MKKEFNIITKSLIVIIKMLFMLVKSILTIWYILVRGFNNLVAKLFNLLPRLAKVSIIYTLVGLSILNFIDVQPLVDNAVAKENTTTKVEIKNEEKVVVENELQETEIEQVQENTCTLKNEIACKIYQKALSNGLTKEQSLLVVAISAHETGHWTSKVFKEKNNFGGVMCNTGLKSYASQEEGLNGFVDLLTNNYFGKGLNTIEQIGAKYCPVGAENDPHGLNKNWVPSVTNIYQSYLQSVK